VTATVDEPEPIADRSTGRLMLLRLSVGKEESIRPADLVGAIAGEAGIPSRVIGAIKIHDDYSLVEVPEELSDRIIEALRSTKIRGHRVTVQAKPAR
jgi:ATP-dependent RNA helicase DeaD